MPKSLNVDVAISKSGNVLSYTLTPTTNQVADMCLLLSLIQYDLLKELIIPATTPLKIRALDAKKEVDLILNNEGYAQSSEDSVEIHLKREALEFLITFYLLYYLDGDTWHSDPDIYSFRRDEKRTDTDLDLIFNPPTG